MDGVRIQQVFWNILKNAIKFSSESQTLSISTSNPTPGTIEIRFKDQGIGISSESLSRLSTPFEQGPSNTTQKFGGLGLGLAIAKAVVELHGGTVSAESAGEGHGASFVIRLPLAEKCALATPQKIPQSFSAAAGVRVLVVEDHADTAEIRSKLLKISGYLVKTDGTAHAALETISAEPFDIMVSDVGLPDATGYELMQEIRKRFDIKGIAMTGYGMEEDFARSREAGFIAHIVKPINIEQLEQVIRRVMSVPSA